MPEGLTLQLTSSELIGLGGALLYSISYLLAAYDLLPSQSPMYYASKLAAAAMVLISLSQDFNLASAVIQVFFITVSMIGIVRHLDRERRGRAYEQSQHAPRGAAEG